MPNWTSNTIRIEGCAEEIRAFLNFVSGDDTGFDFDKLIPMPELLRHTARGLRAFDGEEYRNWYVLDPDLGYADTEGWKRNERPLTAGEQAALADIGYNDWYEWAIANWGTKWNACHVEIDEGPEESGVCEIRFDTAWSAPLPVFRDIAARFPSLAFEFSWTDEDEPGVTHSMVIRAGAQ